MCIRTETVPGCGDVRPSPPQQVQPPSSPQPPHRQMRHQMRRECVSCLQRRTDPWIDALWLLAVLCRDRWEQEPVYSFIFYTGGRVVSFPGEYQEVVCVFNRSNLRPNPVPSVSHAICHTHLYGTRYVTPTCGRVLKLRVSRNIGGGTQTPRGWSIEEKPRRGSFRRHYSRCLVCPP